VHGKQYDLVFGTHKIGVVTETGSDFPNLSGTIEYDPALATLRSQKAARLVRFIAFMRESTRLLDLASERDVSRELDGANAELDAYTDYIDSEDWYLIDGDGSRIPVMCPIFHGSGEIVWRWDVPGKRNRRP
jgi:hypothetical protein